MTKIALIDYDDTIVKWSHELRAQVIGGILQDSQRVDSTVLERIKNDFQAIVKEARTFAGQHGISQKSTTVLFDYLFQTVPGVEGVELIANAKANYRSKIAATVPIYPKVVEQLQSLKDQGYILAIITNKDKDIMQMEYQALTQNYPELAILIPSEHVFATTEQLDEKPNDFLHRQALVTLQGSGKILLGGPLEILIIGDSISKDVGAAINFHTTLFGGRTHFRHLDELYHAPDPYNSRMRFALFDPGKEHNNNVLTPLKLLGVEAFAIDSWDMLGQLLAGERKCKPESRDPHSEDELEAFSGKYLTDCKPGYYMLRTRPRCWAQVTEDKNLIIGKKAAPVENGSFYITFVDVEDILEIGRNRFYTQNLFVHSGKIFNAAAYVWMKDMQGAEHILLINDKRKWNVPIGRVDGDELTKEENQALISAVPRGVGPENAHCILAALRELREEAGFDVSKFIAEKHVRLLSYSSDDINGHTLSNEDNYATTVTMQIMIDLGTLTNMEIEDLQSQLRPQEDEDIEQVKIVPVAQIKRDESATEETFFWQESEEKHPIFKHVGKVITSLHAQKLMPFDQKNKEEPAPFYVTKDVLERLMQSSDSYVKKDTGDEFITIKLDLPLNNLNSDERAETGQYIFLAKKDRYTLAKTLKIMENMHEYSINLNTIPGLSVINEDSIHHSYTKPWTKKVIHEIVAARGICP